MLTSVVNDPNGPDGGRHRLLPAGRRRDVERNPDHRVVVEAVDRGIEFGGAEIAGRDEKPVGTQPLGDGPALPAGGAGDQRNALWSVTMTGPPGGHRARRW